MNRDDKNKDKPILDHQERHEVTRVIGRYGNKKKGVTVIAIGAMHGNEPTGVKALKRVFQALEKHSIALRGELIGLVGNLRGLKQDKRYIDYDLNRLWTKENIKKIQCAETLYSEHCEQKEILEIVFPLLKEKKDPVVFLDLHTTSAEGAAFSIIEDSLCSRDIAASFPAPVILGLLEKLKGTFLNYVNELGYAGIGFEGGEHKNFAAVENHEVILWSTLVALECLVRDDLPSSFYPLAKKLRKETRNLPHFLEVTYRHEIKEGDGFKMLPGFKNFASIAGEEELANDNNGKIKAPSDGCILLPLYQGQGDDGFFLARPVWEFWLKLAKVMRKFHLEFILPYLPGLRRHPHHPDKFIVNTRFARWRSDDIFHLLGYRKESCYRHFIVYSKIHNDLHFPTTST